MHHNPGLIVGGGPQNTSELSTDGDCSLRQPKIQTHLANQKNQFQVNPDFPYFNNSMDPRSFPHSSPGSLSMETKRREQRMADLWSHSNGVSQSQFLSVVRELKRAQNALKEALKKPGLGDRQIETSSNLSLEGRVKAQQREICDLKQRIENLQVHKKQLKNDIEGISVAPSSSSFEISRTSRENSFSKEEAEFSRREKQLQDEINNWKQKVENLKKENYEMKDTCSRLEKSLEEEKMSSIQRLTELTKENVMFTKRLAEAEENLTIHIAQVHHLNHEIKVESGRLQKMRESYEQAIQDKYVYEQRIQEMKLGDVQETNRYYESSKTMPHSKYEKPVRGGIHRTVEDLQEALKEVTRQPSHSPRTYWCDRCYEEFTIEVEYLQHIQKCYD